MKQAFAGRCFGIICTEPHSTEAFQVNCRPIGVYTPQVNIISGTTGATSLEIQLVFIWSCANVQDR
jgi:hypothetical protein